MTAKTETTAQVSDKLTPLQQALLDRADTIMDSMARTVEKASSFAAEQVPDIALQYVAYGRASLTAYVVLSLMLLGIAFYLGVRIALMNSRGYPEDSYSWDDRRQGAMMVSIPTAVLGVGVFLHNMNSFIMVWIAPKIWLMNEIALLVKQRS
jgi:hypothetical protein